MKKLFYTLLIVLTCFIGLNKVSAHNYDGWSPESITINGSSVFDTWQSGSYVFYGIKSPPSNDLFYSITYDFNLVHNNYDIYYDFTFLGYSDEIWDYSNKITNGSLSISWRGAGINYGGSCFINSVGTDKLFTITCQNVRLEGSEHLYLDITLNTVYNIKTNALFGIRNYIWSSTTSQQSLINAINSLNSNQQSINQNLEQQNEKLDESINQQKETNQKLDETNDTLKDDNTSESTSEATEFFEGFDTDTHGLTSIITAPLELIGNIAGSTCSPLPLQVPFVNKTMSLPCMSSIYKKHFGSFLTVYQTITFGIVAYWVCVRIFALVKDFKNPEHDEIEVMDL